MDGVNYKNTRMAKKIIQIVVYAGGLLFWLMILAGIFSRAAGQEKSDTGKLLSGYKVTPAKVATWAGFGVAGVMWGGREAYHADPKVFEEKWNVSEYSFLGSQAWQRQYVGNRYEPHRIHKPEVFNAFRDFWHFSGTGSRVIWLTGTFSISAGKQPLKHKVLDMLIGSVVSSGTAAITYKYLRQ